MRKGIFSGKAVYLTEKEWRELLKRFDVSRAVKKGDELFEIPSDGCYLCTKYREGSTRSCSGCPLDSDVNTCGDVMEDVVGGSFAFHAEVLSSVWWGEYGEGCNARAHIRKIHKALMNMERVRGKGR